MTEALLNPWFTTLAWALVHTLWAFTLSAGLAYGVCHRLSHATARYRVYQACLLCFPFVFGVLCWWHAPVFLDAGTPTSIPVLPIIQEGGTGKEPAVPWSGYLTACYLLGVALGIFRTVYQYWLGRSLRSEASPPPPEARQVFSALRGDTTAAWQISTRITTVMVIGFFRPVILFPIGLLNHLTPAETEAVLLHELAHLRRNDHRWIALQQFIRDLFFYHPIVYWLCKQLDREREYACDDTVTQQIPERAYAQALLRVARFSSSSTSNSLAMQATSSLHHRLRRIIHPGGNRSASYPYLLTLCLVVGSLWLVGAQTVAPEQTGNVSGRVVDGTNFRPLIGTNITTILDGQSIGTVTDFNGFYALSLPPGEHSLTFSYVGYPSSTRTIVVDSTAQLDVILQSQDGNANGSVGIGRSPAASPTTDGEKSLWTDETILFILDGKRTEIGSENDLDPLDIAKVDIYKDAKTIKSFGYGTDFSAAMIITLRE